MYKLVVLVKRKPGLTRQQFKDYFETKHVKFGEKYLPPYCTKYIRRYLIPQANPMTPNQPPHPDFDALVELWFADEEQFKAFQASVAGEADVHLVVEDEERFQDRNNVYRYLVEEHQSWGPE
jgi:EthD domain